MQSMKVSIGSVNEDSKAKADPEAHKRRFFKRKSELNGVLNGEGT